MKWYASLIQPLVTRKIGFFLNEIPYFASTEKVLSNIFIVI